MKRAIALLIFLLVAMPVSAAVVGRVGITDGDYRIDTLDVTTERGPWLMGGRFGQKEFDEGDVAVVEKSARGVIGREVLSGVMVWGELGSATRKGTKTVIAVVEGKPVATTETVFDLNEWSVGIGAAAERSLGGKVLGRLGVGARREFGMSIAEYHAMALWKISEPGLGWRLAAGYRGELRDGKQGPRGFLLGLDVRF